MSELDRRDFLKIVGLSAGAAATVGLRTPGQARPLRHPARRDHARASPSTTRRRAPGVHGRLRSPREDPRRPPDQGRGQPRPPDQPGQALRPRPGRASPAPIIPDRIDRPATRAGDGSAPVDQLGRRDLQGRGEARLRGGQDLDPRRSGRSDADGPDRQLRDGRRPRGPPHLRQRSATPGADRGQRAGLRRLRGADLRPLRRGRRRRLRAPTSSTPSVELEAQFSEARDIAKHARRRCPPDRGHAAPEPHGVERRPLGRGGARISEGVLALALAKAVAQKKGVSVGCRGERRRTSARRSRPPASARRVFDAIVEKLAQRQATAVALPPGVAAIDGRGCAGNAAAVLLLNVGARRGRLAADLPRGGRAEDARASPTCSAWSSR